MMTLKQRARFFVLQKKGKRGKKRTENEQAEWEALCEKRHNDILSMIPLPMCCENARKYPVVTFSVDETDPEEEDDEPEEGDALPPLKATADWYIEVADKFLSVRRSEHEDYYSVPWPSPKFCPYCGASLPKMRLKDPVPETICRVLDGGYYCSTCDDRLNECMCDPQSSAYEEDITT